MGRRRYTDIYDDYHEWEHLASKRYRPFSRVRNWALFRCEKIKHHKTDKHDIAEMIYDIDQRIGFGFTVNDKYIFCESREDLMIVRLVV